MGELFKSTQWSNQKQIRKQFLMICSFLFMFENVLSQETYPEVFEHGIISTGLVEFCTSFSSDMDEVYFVRSSDKWGKGELKTSIYTSNKIDGNWSEPSIAPFSGKFNDSDPYLTKDGLTLYFISERPSEEQIESPDIWMVRRMSDGNWDEAERMDNHVNSVKSEYGPRSTANGNLYFVSERDGGYGQGDIYMSEKRGDDFHTPVNLGNIINGPKGEWNLEISDDEEILIFEASQRKENKSSYGDLYISYKRENGWTVPQNIIEINTTGSDLCPELINQNNTLIFSSSQALRNEWVNIY